MMAEAKKAAKKPKADDGFTAEERAAMRERAAELKRSKGKLDGEQDLLAQIARMEGLDKVLAERIHAIVKEVAPSLEPKTWYGMPAYARDGKVVCFFQNAGKFKARYSTLGFNDAARLDDGNMWPTSFALTRLTAADEKRIAELVKRAVGG